MTITTQPRGQYRRRWPVPSSVAGTVYSTSPVMEAGTVDCTGDGGRYSILYRPWGPVPSTVPAMVETKATVESKGAMEAKGQWGHFWESQVSFSITGCHVIRAFHGSFLPLSMIAGCHGQTELRSRDQMSRDELRSRDQMITGCHVIGGFHGSCLPPQ